MHFDNNWDKLMLYLPTVGISLPFGEIKAYRYIYIYIYGPEEDRQVGRNIGGLYNVSYLHLCFFFRYLNFMAQNFNPQPSMFTLVKIDNTKANSANECKYPLFTF